MWESPLTVVSLTPLRGRRPRSTRPPSVGGVIDRLRAPRSEDGSEPFDLRCDRRSRVGAPRPVLHPATKPVSRGQDVLGVDTCRASEPFAYFLRYRADIGPPGFRLVVTSGDGGLGGDGDPRQEILDA